ncbi:MAG: hypothetical protein RSA22_14875 [Acinetobacter sp.]
MNKLALIFPFVLISPLHAETLAQFEKKLIKQYEQKAFYEINQDIESAVVAKIKQDPTSFDYSFPNIQDSYSLRIHFSPDKKLKFYTFDVGSGGTMGEHSSYVQSNSTGKSVLTPIETGFILDVKQTAFAQQPVYLVENYYKASSCMGAYAINAFKPNPDGSMQPVKIFQTKKAALNHVEVSFDCQNHQGGQEVPEYIRIDKKLNTIDFLLLNKDGKPLGKYLRYAKTQSNYQYSGVVK